MVIYFKGTLFAPAYKTSLFTSQNRVEISWKNSPFLLSKAQPENAIINPPPIWKQLQASKLVL
jgi:hypothetical protein